MVVWRIIGIILKIVINMSMYYLLLLSQASGNDNVITIAYFARFIESYNHLCSQYSLEVFKKWPQSFILSQKCDLYDYLQKKNKK